MYNLALGTIIKVEAINARNFKKCLAFLYVPTGRMHNATLAKFSTFNLGRNAVNSCVSNSIPKNVNL
jgi:hypothetical protein